MASTLISVPQLAAHLDDPDWLILDVRHDLADPSWGRRAYEESHIPRALFVSLDEDLSAPLNGKNGRHPLPTPTQSAERLARFGVTQGKQIVAYDQGSSMFAARLWWMLRWLGLDSCAVLDGGWAQWQAAGQTAGLPTGLSVSAAKETPQPAHFMPQPQDLAVSADAVLASLSTQTMTLIDARPAPRFRGENETLDPVGGHIPGALNRPFTENLNADGTFKSAEQLRAEFAALLKDIPASRIVHQCGSGVTACHNSLAMEIAGFSSLRLYPGSWSEWCSDPARPVAR